jgi:tetratricopeptide (TPR) repeat protein
MKTLLTLSALVLLAVSPVQGEDTDSLQLFLQQGDSCMRQYNTFDALRYYQRAFNYAEAQNVVQFSMEDADVHSKYIPEDRIPREVRLKLADCHYKRANYRQTAELLKNMPEDSLSHDAFRQLAYSYQKQGDNDSFIYWAGQLVNRFPMDGEVVAGLTLAYAKANQPEKGVICGIKYSLKDSTNILVNRALADAWFMNRSFTAAAMMYDRLMEQGDSTFNTLYSAGMCYSQIEDLERAYKYLQLAFLISGMQHAGCAYRLGVVCVDTKRYPEGLNYLNLAKELLRPDSTIMKAITLSEGEGYYLTQHYPEAVEAWKEHLTYNPTSVATYYNIANAYAYILKDQEQARDYYQQFIEQAAEVENPTPQLSEMVATAREMLQKQK